MLRPNPMFLKEKIKTEKNKKESRIKGAVKAGLSRFLQKILPEWSELITYLNKKRNEVWRFFAKCILTLNALLRGIV